MYHLYTAPALTILQPFHGFFDLILSLDKIMSCASLDYIFVHQIAIAGPLLKFLNNPLLSNEEKLSLSFALSRQGS